MFVPERRSENGIMKVVLIILLVLCALLLLVAGILMINIKITLGMRPDFFWKLTACGIPINPEQIMKKKGRKDSKDRNRKGGILDKILNGFGTKPVTKDKESDTSEAEDSTSDLQSQLSMLLGSVVSLVRIVPKGIRVRLRRLKIKVACEDAADTALWFGRYHALAAGTFAALSEYKGFGYGFSANKRKISITTDFESSTTTVDFELTVSFFLWQLIMMILRFGVDYFIRILNS